MLGHIMTDDRTNMRDDTFEALAYVYTNSEFCVQYMDDMLSPGKKALLAQVSREAFRTCKAVRNVHSSFELIRTILGIEQ